MDISRLIDLSLMGGVGMMVPGPEKSALVDNIARIVSKHVSESRVKAVHADDENYSFLWSSDPFHDFYKQRLQHYRSQNKDADAQDIQPDAPAATHEFVGDLDPPSLPRRECRFTFPRFFGFTFPSGITPKEFGIIKLTALFVARSGTYFRLALMKRVDKNPRFAFMSSTFFSGLILAYSSLLICSDKVPDATLLKLFFHLADMEMVDLHAFVGGVDCFAYIENQDYYDAMPPPERVSVMMNRLEPDTLGDSQPSLASTFPARWNILKELGIIKLTAQFVAFYGPCFSRLLMEDPRFEFMKPTDSKYNFFSGRVGVYSKVLKDLWRQRRIISASKETTILEVFFDRLQFDKLEEGVEMAMIDLHAFVGGLDFFADMEDENYSANWFPTPDRLSVMIYLCFQSGPLRSQLTEYRNAPAALECVGDAQPDLVPLWDLPLRRTFLALGFPDSEITLKELGIIKLTALFVSRFGSCFSRDLMKRVDKNPQFEFMKPSHSRFDFYCGLIGVYATVLRPSKMLRKSDAPTTTVVDGFFHHLDSSDAHAIVGGVDWFAYMENEEYSANFSPPERLSVTMNQLKQMQPPLGSQRTKDQAQNQDGVQDAQPDLEPLPFRYPSISPLNHAFGLDRYSLGIIKLTAQFMARYGPHFYWYLMERVDKKPQFDFMKPSADGRSYILLNVLVEAYSRVLRLSDQLSDASTAATIVEGFFYRLQLEKLEEGVEMAMIDLHAFVGGVDWFVHMENEEYSATFPPPEHVSVMMNQHRLTRRLQLASFHVHPRSYDQPLVGLMLPEETEPKRQKFDESALVPEDPGSSKTSVSVEQTNM